jgi:hypothetical protein
MTYGRVDVEIHVFLNRQYLEVGGQFHASATLPPLDRKLGGPDKQSARVGWRKILSTYRHSNSDPRALQPVASRCTGSYSPSHEKSECVFVCQDVESLRC